MGHGDRTLVVMTNGDVYYLSQSDGERLREIIEGGVYKTWAVRDLKTSNLMILVLTNISAIVEEVSRG